MRPLLVPTYNTSLLVEEMLEEIAESRQQAEVEQWLDACNSFLEKYAQELFAAAASGRRENRGITDTPASVTLAGDISELQFEVREAARHFVDTKASWLALVTEAVDTAIADQQARCRVAEGEFNAALREISYNQEGLQQLDAEGDPETYQAKRSRASLEQAIARDLEKVEELRQAVTLDTNRIMFNLSTGLLAKEAHDPRSFFVYASSLKFSLDRLASKLRELEGETQDNIAVPELPSGVERSAQLTRHVLEQISIRNSL